MTTVLQITACFIYYLLHIATSAPYLNNHLIGNEQKLRGKKRFPTIDGQGQSSTFSISIQSIYIYIYGPNAIYIQQN